jgi:hypothetical protein
VTTALAADTAAVADLTATWLTAGGLFVGVIVTSTFNLLAARSNRKGLARQTELQLQGQREQLQLQGASEHKKWRREVRRDAYVTFVVSVEQVRNLIGPISEVLPEKGRSATPEELTTLESLRKDLQVKYDAAFQQGQVVRLEGPKEAGEAAQKLLDATAFLSNAASDRARAAEADRAPEYRLWSDAVREMHRALEVFLAAASQVMALE